MPPGSHSNPVPRSEKKTPLTKHMANHFNLVLKLRVEASRTCEVRPCSSSSWPLRTRRSFSMALLLGAAAATSSPACRAHRATGKPKPETTRGDRKCGLARFRRARAAAVAARSCALSPRGPWIVGVGTCFADLAAGRLGGGGLASRQGSRGSPVRGCPRSLPPITWSGDTAGSHSLLVG